MPAPEHDESKSFEEMMADQALNLFFHRVLLKKNLNPLRNFIQNRVKITNLDPMELPELRHILENPITGPISEINQWRFKDKPYMFAFQGWRVGKFPQLFTQEMWQDYEVIHAAFRENEASGTGTIRLTQLSLLLYQLDEIYDRVAAEMDPHLKKIWVNNNITLYEQWEGKTENLPGRLTPQLVNAMLAELREYKRSLREEAAGTEEQLRSSPPSTN